MDSSVEVGAYFYPITQYCAERHRRTHFLGEELAIDGLREADEIALARQAQPLFEGHLQPQTYCLGRSEEIRTEWDDSTASDLIQQLVLARSSGLSYLVFDSYTGMRDGRRVKEMREPLRIAGMAKQLGLFGLKYARMETLESPRAVLPIPYSDAKEGGLSKFFREPGRQYDLSPDTAKAIVDDCQQDWQNFHYLRVNGWRPYLSILMPNIPDEAKPSLMAPIVETIYDHAIKQYGELPYLVGVMRNVTDIQTWASLGVDAVTEYCHLPQPGESIQQYSDLVDIRQREWLGFTMSIAKTKTPFVPSPAVGWDASPRGELGHTLEEVSGMHPYTPIVVGNTPREVARMLSNAIQFAKTFVPKGQRQVTMFAWNEITEGASLLPRLRSDGTIDNSYLEAVQEAIQNASTTHMFPK